MTARLSDLSCPKCGSYAANVEIIMPDGVDITDRGLRGTLWWHCRKCGAETRVIYRADFGSLAMDGWRR